MAYRLLRNNGFAPAWIEERKDLLAAAAILRGNLARAWEDLHRRWRTDQPSPVDEESWRRTLGDFRRQVEELNQRIFSYNLKSPSKSVHILPLDAEREIESLTGERN